MAGMGTPIIAAVNGLAAGAAVSIALACDLRVVDENATFQTPFVNVGLVPDAGATWILPRMVGMAKASAMMLLGQPLTASEALAAGLINEVCTSVEVLERAFKMARGIANASSTVGVTRQLVQNGLGRSLEEQLEAEATAQLLAHHAPDFAEARQAFAEKRKPRFW